MLMPGDIDLSSVPRHTDPLKVLVQQAMLKREAMYNPQIHGELHRRSKTRRSLMMDIVDNNECGSSYNSRNVKARSCFLPPKDALRYELLAKEARFSSVTEVRSTHTLKQDILEESTQKSVNLQLSADEFIHQSGDDLQEKGNVWNLLKEPSNFQHPPTDRNSSMNKGELKLSLGTKRRTRMYGVSGTSSTRFDKNDYLYNNPIVIDLEDSVGKTHDDYARCSRMPDARGTSATWFDQNRHLNNATVINLEDPVQDNNARRPRMPDVHGVPSTWFDKNRRPNNKIVIDLEDSLDKAQESSARCTPFSSVCQSTSREELTVSKNEGKRRLYYERGPRDDSCNGISSGGQLFLDLNEEYRGDSYSAGACTGLLGSVEEGILPVGVGKQQVICRSNETSGGRADNNVSKLTLLDLNIKCESTGCELENDCDDGRIGSFKSQIESSEDPGSCADTKTNLVKLKSNNLLLQDLNHMPARDGGEMSCGTSGVDNPASSMWTDESQNALHGNKSPSSCKSCISDNNSGSIKTTNSITGSNINCPARATLSVSDGENGGLLNKQAEQPARVEDAMMRRAAVSLIYLALDDTAAAAPFEDSKPQYSIDSYELIAMNLTQNMDDEDSASSSKPFEADLGEVKDLGSKWKRGRRLKDFQKEILPGIATLSRLEIREDINILEGVLRSREYKRMQQAKGVHEENWSGLAKGKRSRRNCVGKRKSS
ncbi:unnamed protein product [Linum tenue]|uniref:Uncharacterized protein n=1 Tax=Linum tenue TaxID=586396 RepID=A0AAV0JVE4_9ROSI|nr:unnamed protein product [Linum tenue]